ncbi:hypothetical protein UlMin_026537 [Ulmus minor]
MMSAFILTFRITRSILEHASAPNYTLHSLSSSKNVTITLLDNMLIKSLHADHHLDHLHQAFEVLQKYNMKLNPTKCSFSVASVFHPFSETPNLTLSLPLTLCSSFLVTTNRKQRKKPEITEKKEKVIANRELKLLKMVSSSSRSDRVICSMKQFLPMIGSSQAMELEKKWEKLQVLQLLVKVYQKLPSPDYLSICQCLMFLDEPEGVASILEKLLRSENKDDALLAIQIAFDLVENEHQAFLLNVRDRLSVPKVQHTESAQPKSKEADTSQNENSAPEDVQMTEESSCEPDPSEVIYSERLTKIKGILSGETSIQLTLQFLSNLLILKTIKQSVEMRNSVRHSATIYANAIMHAGTTVDTFLRENLDWLSRATNWAKFSATAGLGVIHRGHLQQGRSLMAPYLPQGAVGGGGSPYSEGGALYALGLIHANHGEGIKQFLRDSLRSTNVEVIHHGACLGLGLAALGTADEEIYEDIKTVLYTDSAVASEAAGISLGLLMVGTASEKASEMLAYAHETQHEKIIRGLALGIALTVYGREEEADTLIEQMTRDQDPILRYGGMYALALAYSGTANNKAIRQLLHFAVSDVSDDVKRTVVLALGFVLYSEPEQTPRIVSLLSESYNPHVRYGAALVVGISCAGTGLSEAISLLEPLTSDVVDFVRQGALIAMAMVMVQTSTYPTGHGPNLIMASLKHLYDLVLVFYLKAILYQHSRYAKFQICNLGAYSCNLSLIYFISLGILFSSTIIYFFYSSHNFLLNFREFISFLEENHVDLSNVKVNFFIVFLRLYK